MKHSIEIIGLFDQKKKVLLKPSRKYVLIYKNKGVVRDGISVKKGISSLKFGQGKDFKFLTPGGKFIKLSRYSKKDLKDI